MTTNQLTQGCRTLDHVNRRTLLKAAGLSGLGWLTPVAGRLALAQERSPRGQPAKSVILIWLAGGPSQLETFDPHPGSEISAGSRARKTAAQGIEIDNGFEQLADQMHDVAIVRSVLSKEGDHERATYTVKSGYRPDPTVVHPSIGAVVCHQLPVGTTEIPRHVSILPGRWPGRGGYLGDAYDAFKMDDPRNGLPDVQSQVAEDRFVSRLNDLQVVDRHFSQGRLRDLEQQRTLHRTAIDRAVRMMSSEQLDAFNIAKVPASERLAFGDTPFGRGVLAAMRLVDVGVRCVEITLGGWDSHIGNHESHAELVNILDPAIAALIRQLRERGLLDQTVVICGGEFGRTPQMNLADGRDHWPHGFSICLAGGGVRGGQAIGATDPSGGKKLVRPVEVADVHASLLSALGVDFKQQLDTPVGRPLRISEGKVIKGLFG